MEKYYLNVSLGACLTIILIIVDYIRKYNTDIVQRRLFLAVLFSALAATVADFLDHYFGGRAGVEINNGLYAILSIFLLAQNCAFYLTFVFIDYFGFKNASRSKNILRVLSVLMAVYLVSVLFNLHFHYYFSISGDNRYTPEKLYPLRLAISYLPLLLSIGLMVVFSAQFKRAQIISIIFFGLLTGLGSVLDIMLKKGSLTWPCFAAALLYFYFFIVQSDSKLDSLTGLGNRSSFNEFIEKLSGGTAGDAQSVVMLDMDRFKEINDTLGHLEGDNALRDMASIIKGIIRTTDFAARYGGDEFIIAVRSEFNVERLMERLQTAIDNQNEKGKRPYKLYMSYGWDTFVPGGGKTFEEFLVGVDRMMYERKAANKAARLASEEAINRES